MMCKKLFYCVSVAALTLSLLSSQGQAIYELELNDVITKFVQRSSPSPSSSKEETEVTEEPASYWSMVGSLFVPLAHATGSSFKYLGDVVRGDNAIVGKLLSKEASSRLGEVTIGYVSGNDIAEVADEGTLEALRKGTGNTLRWIGCCFKEETPTLSRELRNFWLDTKRMSADVEKIFTSTACSLFMNILKVGSIEGVAHEYLSFFCAWNLSSRTVPVKDKGAMLDYFTKGIIRALVKNRVPSVDSQKLLGYLNASDFDILMLPCVSGITIETLYPKKEDRESKSQKEIEMELTQFRLNAFDTYVKGAFSKEQLSFQFEEAAQRLQSGEGLTNFLAIQGSSASAVTGSSAKEKTPNKEEEID